MAVYAVIDGGRPIQNGGAVVHAPQPKSTEGFIQQGKTEDVPVANAYAAVLNARYKTGGTTTWERPGSA